MRHLPGSGVLNMNVVDTHCHVSPVWFEPVETLLFHMDRHGVTRAVLTQLLGQTDNSYQEQCLRKYPGRFASVVGVDIAAPDSAERLRVLADDGACGVRLRPDMRSPGADPYAVWRVAAEKELTVSCVGPAASFLTPEFADVLHEFPSLRVAAEHLCGWGRPDCDRTAATLDSIKGLARFANFNLKVPPLGQLVKRDAKLRSSGRTLEPGAAGVVLELLDLYGADRLCWASDFPVVSSREGYGNALQWSRELFENSPEESQAEIFAGTAGRLFFHKAGRASSSTLRESGHED